MFNDPNLKSKWDDVRKRFRASMMAQTEIHKLAQNIDASWSIRGKEETPEKYLSHTIEELAFFPEFRDKPDRFPLLINILEETLAFDDPFGEMVEYVDSSSKKDESASKSFEKLGIPQDFPIKLTHFNPETKEFCEGESIEDIKSFVTFAQSMAQNIVVGGDFKKLLNSLTHLDESAIRTYLPIRKGEPGVFLAESIALFASDLNKEGKRYLLQLFDIPPVNPELNAARPLGRTEKDRIAAKIKKEMELRTRYFKAESEKLEAIMNSEKRDQERFFLHLKDPEIENISWAIASFHYLGHPDSRKKGLLNRFFGR